MLSTFLKRAGFGIASQAADGAEALGMMQGVELVITDCQMPNMDGITFVRTLRAQGQAMPVIMLSGQNDPGLIQTALMAGVNQYIEKPLKPLSLIETIRGLMQDRQAIAA
jgi:two-component system chemotaxis response regulator CheY